MVADSAGVTVARHDWVLADLHHVPETNVAKMTHVHDHPEPIKLPDDLDAELAETTLRPVVGYTVGDQVA
jgi:hypothetical protein